MSASEQALLAYADVLTRTPQAVTMAHVDALRAVGYTDRAIHDACAIIGYFAFVNRIANGLGVAVESKPAIGSGHLQAGRKQLTDPRHEQ